MVKFDDFVEWYCRADAFPAIPDSQPAKTPQPAHADASIDLLDEPVSEVFLPAAFEETAKERAARFKREAHDALRRRGLVP